MIASLLSMPLFWATLTIAGFVIGQHIYRLSGNNPFTQPVLLGLLLVVVVVELSGTSYHTYMQGGD